VQQPQRVPAAFGHHRDEDTLQGDGARQLAQVPEVGADVAGVEQQLLDAHDAGLGAALGR